MNLTLQTLDAMCQNTLQRLSQKCQFAHFLLKQEPQLSQRDRATLRVIVKAITSEALTDTKFYYQ